MCSLYHESSNGVSLIISQTQYNVKEIADNRKNILRFFISNNKAFIYHFFIDSYTLTTQLLSHTSILYQSIFIPNHFQREESDSQILIRETAFGSGGKTNEKSCDLPQETEAVPGAKRQLLTSKMVYRSPD